MYIYINIYIYIYFIVYNIRVAHFMQTCLIFHRSIILFMSQNWSVICQDHLLLCTLFKKNRSAKNYAFLWGHIGLETIDCRKTPGFRYFPFSHPSWTGDWALNVIAASRNAEDQIEQACYHLLQHWEYLWFVPSKKADRSLLLSFLFQQQLQQKQYRKLKFRCLILSALVYVWILIQEEIVRGLDVVIHSPTAFPVRHNDLTGQSLHLGRKRSGDENKVEK